MLESATSRGCWAWRCTPTGPRIARAYVHYSAREGDGDTVLAEFRVTDEPLPPRLDPTTQRVLLTLDQP